MGYSIYYESFVMSVHSLNRNMAFGDNPCDGRFPRIE